MAARYLMDNRDPTGLPLVVDEFQNRAVTRSYAYGLQRTRGSVEGRLCFGISWNPYVYAPNGPVNATGPTCKDLFETDSFPFYAFRFRFPSIVPPGSSVS